MIEKEVVFLNESRLAACPAGGALGAVKKL